MPRQVRGGRGRRQFACLALLAALVLAGCGSKGPGQGNVGHVKGFLGGVAGDEPRAVVIARDVLSAGGSAVDAAVAGYFTMAVTLPSSASLGGGGMCLVLDKVADTAEILDFTHPSEGQGAPVPANVRGMFALHAKYGNLQWRQLLARAENMARFGVPASRALARGVAASGTQIASDPGLRKILSGAKGGLIGEGEMIEQLDLAVVLGLIRRRPGDFYTGRLSRKLVDAYRLAGMPLAPGALRGFAPRWRPTVTITTLKQTVDFSPSPAGITAAQMWHVLWRDDYWYDTGKRRRPHLLAELSKRAYADAGRWFHSNGVTDGDGRALVNRARIRRLMAGYRSGRVTPLPATGGGAPGQPPRDQGSASIVAADRLGQAVTCAFTMNGVFGAVREAPGTGIVIAAPPDPVGRGLPPFVLMAHRYSANHELRFMGAATGGPAAPAALTMTALGVLVDNLGLEAAFAAPRLYNAAVPDQIAVEDSGAGRSVAERLRRLGHSVVLVPALGRVNAFACPKGFERADQSVCEVRTDRRGAGLAQSD